MADAAPARLGLTARPGAPLRGRVRAPGDKSISHRAVILGALAHGTTEISGLLESEDIARSLGAAATFGAQVEQTGVGSWRVRGSGAFLEAQDVVDCGNAGTSVRLLLGAAAGFPIATTFTGDASLRSRPMARALRPLHSMGARWIGRGGDRLPLTLQGAELTAIRYVPPEPSAQVKSAILLAGLQAVGVTEVIEPAPTRDHTERMLPAFGARVEVDQTAQGRRVRLAGGQRLVGARIAAPGDPSSAAFLLVAALVVPGSEVTVEGVLLNPLRTGLIDTLIEMGADISIADERLAAGERIGDITARHSSLTGVVAPPERAPAMIDEYPILAIAAAFASGETVMRGIGELRVKESDRIQLTAAGLRACGVEVEEEPDGLIVRGCGGPPAGGGAIGTRGDHRIAMSFLVLGLGAAGGARVDEAAMIATSFPGFESMMASLGADISPA